MKDKELSAYYDALFEMMATPGWAVFMRDVQIMLDGQPEVEHIDSMEQLFRTKGTIDALKWVANSKARYEFGYENQLDYEAMVEAGEITP